jgi:hypothetical protein
MGEKIGFIRKNQIKIWGPEKKQSTRLKTYPVPLPFSNKSNKKKYAWNYL